MAAESLPSGGTGLISAVDDEEAFTGLEAGIILIAFVVVAAVFSYVILGSGFYATEKARQVTSDAGTTPSSLIVSGAVILRTDAFSNPESLNFFCEVIGGEVAMSGIHYTLHTTDMIYQIPKKDIHYRWPSGDPAEGVLSRGKLLSVRLTITDAGLSTGDDVTLTIIPPRGVPVSIPCTVPGTLLGNKRYEVG